MENRFKTSLFGYSKDAVAEYIGEISNEYSNVIMQKQAECENRLIELNRRVAELEAENTSLKAEQIEVYRVMADARRYADEIRRQAESECEQLRKESIEISTAQKQRAIDYFNAVEQIRKNISDVLHKFDDEIGQQQQCFDTEQL